MSKTRHNRAKSPWSASIAWLVLAGALGSWPGTVQAAPSAEPEEVDADAGSTKPEDLPLSQRETRARPHPDCNDAMPLWEHVVQPGEHLGLIAGRYGVRRHDLVKLNTELENPDLIVPGQKVRVCPELAPRLRKDVVYTVKPGDTLSEIASEHDLSVAELTERLQEPIANPGRLWAGATLRFWADGGMVEDFLPPLPKKKRRASGRRSRRHSSVNVQLEPGSGVHIKRPHLAFGTRKTVSLLKRVIRSYRSRHSKAPHVVIGDLSRRGGGKIPPHVSHRRGVDVDVGYVLRGAAAGRTRFTGVTPKNLDLGRTWTLIKAFLDTHEVKYIFMDYRLQGLLYDYALEHGTSARELDELFQYPRGRGRSHGIIRHWPSHRHHFHVRFRG